MLRRRIIPCLLLGERGLVKGKQFTRHSYVGDPIQTVSIFEQMEADELILLDILATQQNRYISPGLIQNLSRHCFSPLTVGGGICSLKQAQELLRSGAEKICLGTTAFTKPDLVTQLVNELGSQSVVVSIDYRESLDRTVFIKCGTLATGMNLNQAAMYFENLGVGEVLLNSIERDGMRTGYDLVGLNEVSRLINIPVIANGGLGELSNLLLALGETRISGAAGGSYFVHYGKREAVLIQYPTQELRNELFQRLPPSSTN